MTANDAFLNMFVVNIEELFFWLGNIVVKYSIMDVDIKSAMLNPEAR